MIYPLSTMRAANNEFVATIDHLSQNGRGEYHPQDARSFSLQHECFTPQHSNIT